MAQIGCRILDGAVAEITRRLVSEIFNELLIGRIDPARPARLPCIINSYIRRRDVRLDRVARRLSAKGLPIPDLKRDHNPRHFPLLAETADSAPVKL
ncbi:hypothetical protein [Bradyrhizobium sp. CB2312]|uniref:hypothetical protein n=1 Tax=Bradyrhizobium sp. CB2312 TaxID=3039155 RepID=UPI0024B136E5|nr:hypothetical protein [Bradyrhizobium sp. CB2312]WFU71353.1 hypothetical protein QA642_40210 [Bradyrhizobium sp. CB2312]